ncbi:MAG TPA: hypothetical protein VG406_03645 [Isosphaeraceae bacterium]|jgi:hypothetical protein|nr:hypothetical protein [Isosphaeraceae bacterium]
MERRRPSGRVRPDRPPPAALASAADVPIPRRLVLDAGLRPEAKAVAIAAAAAAHGRPWGMAGDPTNDQLASWIGLDNLELVGYRDPWQVAGPPRPARTIVPLWKLPELPASLREGAADRTPRDATRRAPDRPGRGRA